MTKTGEAAHPPMQREPESLLDLIRERQREIGVAVTVVAAVAGAIFLWRQSVVKKEERAERALNTAANAYYSGNKTLAQSDLEKMVERYGNTPAGVQGTMLLAQLLYEGGKWEEGINRLETARKSSSNSPFGASLEGLVAAGYADQKKYDDAARHYLAASDKAPFAADKDLYRADAARILVLAGRREEARKIWVELASKLESPSIGEAKIRLGELDAAGVLKP